MIFCTPSLLQTPTLSSFPPYQSPRKRALHVYSAALVKTLCGYVVRLRGCRTAKLRARVLDLKGAMCETLPLACACPRAPLLHGPLKSVISTAGTDRRKDCGREKATWRANSGITLRLP